MEPDTKIADEYINGIYPFDRIPSCRLCFRQHDPAVMGCGLPEHQKLVQAASQFNQETRGTWATTKWKAKLQEQREKFDALYQR